MQRGYSLDLGDAAVGEFRRFRDAHASVTQRDDTPMLHGISLATGVPPCPPGDLDAFALALAPCLLVVTRGLQRHPQEHVLHRLEHNPRHA